MFLWRYCGWKLGTIGSFSPWMMRDGQMIEGRSSMQILPEQKNLNMMVLLFSGDIYMALL